MRFLLEVRNREASRIVEQESYGSPHLDKKTRALIEILLHTIRPSARGLRRALTKAAAGGASRDEIIDALLAAQPIAGTENTVQAIECMLDWEEERGPVREAGAGGDGFRPATKLSDLNQRAPKIVRVGDRSVVLIRLEGDRVTALSNICPHSGGPLGLGTLAGDVLTCPWHDWRFEITSGECLNRPGKHVQTFEVKIEGDKVRVKL
jgi:nitrite reductase/ring-hydroxylating ferredoxin subunit/alkylhydroperoxidase/carboxymuconolactone decarboxylase family protein YurZ